MDEERFEELLMHPACAVRACRELVTVSWFSAMEREAIDAVLDVCGIRGRAWPQRLVILARLDPMFVRPVALTYSRDQFVAMSPNVRAIGVWVPGGGAFGELVRGIADAAAGQWRARWAWQLFTDPAVAGAWGARLCVPRIPDPALVTGMLESPPEDAAAGPARRS
jgi:hypothetical protein